MQQLQDIKASETAATKFGATVKSAACKTKVAVLGATGYAGQELLKILLNHPAAEVVAVASRSYAGTKYCDAIPAFRKKTDLVCSSEDVSQLAGECDIMFLALPPGVAAEQIDGSVLEQTKVIDLSGDFRLKEAQEYGKWYGQDHAHPELLAHAVYGLCEINRAAIEKAQLIANPGCYATAAILAVAPLLQAGLIAPQSIIFDGKSGVSGAGRSPSLGVHFNECNESIKAYQAPDHRHTPEIEAVLCGFSATPVQSTFAAHLVPMSKGILLTAYATLTDAASYSAVSEAFQNMYGEEPFIRLATGGSDLPETRWVSGSNYCDIGFVIDERCNRIVVVSAIDNLIKGAAGQAVQNMNILLGLDERTALEPGFQPAP